jgi:hypothetical protein
MKRGRWVASPSRQNDRRYSCREVRVSDRRIGRHPCPLCVQGCARERSDPCLVHPRLRTASVTAYARRAASHRSRTRRCRPRRRPAPGSSAQQAAGHVSSQSACVRARCACWPPLRARTGCTVGTRNSYCPSEQRRESRGQTRCPHAQEQHYLLVVPPARTAHARALSKAAQRRRAEGGGRGDPHQLQPM